MKQQQLVVPPAAWARHFTFWVAWLTAAGHPESTLYMRHYHLRRFAVAHAGRDAWTITLDDLTVWLAGQDWSKETRRSYRSSLRSFYSWADATGRVTTDPSRLLPAITVPRGKPRPAPERVYRLAMMAAEERTALMIRVAGQTGLRRGELARIHSDDLVEDLMGASLRITGKGGVVRLVPLLEELAELLIALGEGWAFPGRTDGHLSPAHVGKLVSAALGPNWTTHTLRHRFASRAYAADRDILAVQELLGHASVATTQIYTLVPDGALRAAVRAAA